MSAIGTEGFRLAESVKRRHSERKEKILSLQEFLELCRTDPGCYATVFERLLDAIGEPTLVDTSKDPRLGRIHSNRTIRVYKSFEDFYGMEETIERLIGFLKHAALGLEERKQVLYLLGPVGGGKSSLAERIKELAEKRPVYVVAIKDEKNNFVHSPIFESPFSLFGIDDADELEKEYGVPKARIKGLRSPWLEKRFEECDKDLSKFFVMKIFPSKLKQICIAKTEPGDENNQDVSTLIGKVNIRKLEEGDQNDPDTYLYSGALNCSNQGILDFVEMFKAPIKTLHPLLTTTQEGNYAANEGMGNLPYEGLILAHSNETEWQKFRGAKENEAFLDRIFIVKVPYCLRVEEEVKIYQKMLKESKISTRPAPGTRRLLARFAVLTRLKEHPNSTLMAKMRVYDGENLKDVDPQAKSHQEYADAAGVDEGMTGISTRFAFKVLSETFTYDPEEIAADPVHLMYVLEGAIRREQFSKEIEEKYLEFLKTLLSQKYAEFIGKEIQKAYLESYTEYGQNLFDRYISYADAWIEDQGYRDPDTGQMFERSILDTELQKIERPAGINNPKDFRNEVVKFVLRARSTNAGKNPDWRSYTKLREVIENRMFSNFEQILPVISFEGKKGDSKTEKHHKDFVKRMQEKGYTERQVRRLVEWYIRVKKS